MPRRKPIDEPLVTQVGNRIRALRLERGLSLRRLAELGGCSTDILMEIELGRSLATTRTLQAIARGLQVRLLDLLNLDTEGDIGYLIEHMRLDPDSVRLVRESIASTLEESWQDEQTPTTNP